MAKREQRGGTHRFGGEWTGAKLRALQAYLRAYTTALKNAPFKIAYIDAFAGSGYRRPQAHGRADERQQADLFPKLAEKEPQELLAGSARLALEVEPPFDKYIFIEQDADRCRELELLKKEFPDRAAGIDIQNGDANAIVQELCQRDWRNHRAVLFLDPYGLQVEWSTLEAVAATRAIDTWLLFPLGMGVNRMLPRSGEIPDEWGSRLDRLFGTPKWRDKFYRVENQPSLFDDDEAYLNKATLDDIGAYFMERLASIFAGVAKKPGVLRNSRNNPLYLLCFAVANPKGKNVALKIADHILKDMC